MLRIFQNRFLKVLSIRDRDSLLKTAKRLQLPRETILFEPDQEVKSAYFLESGILSLVSHTEDGRSTEVGIIGREGVVNAIATLGPLRPTTQGIIQVEGEGIQIPFAQLKAALKTSPDMQTRLLESVQSEAMSAGMVAACQRLHSAKQRLARWLLMIHDRVQTDALAITHTFISVMLGTTRPQVTLVLGDLQHQGVLELHRGKVVLLNRAALEANACECYWPVKRMHDGLYSKPLRS